MLSTCCYNIENSHTVDTFHVTSWNGSLSFLFTFTFTGNVISLMKMTRSKLSAGDQWRQQQKRIIFNALLINELASVECHDDECLFTYRQRDDFVEQHCWWHVEVENKILQNNKKNNTHLIRGLSLVLYNFTCLYSVGTVHVYSLPSSLRDPTLHNIIARISVMAAVSVWWDLLSCSLL